MAGEPIWRRVPKLSTNFEEILSRAQGNAEYQNKALESSIIIINYCIFIIIIIIIIITSAYYKHVINAPYNYCICNKVLLEECDKEDNMEVTGGF
jgi:hypothetical protein